MVLPAPVRGRIRQWAEESVRAEAEELNREIMSGTDTRLKAQWAMFKISLFEATLKTGSAQGEQQREDAETILTRLAEAHRQEAREGPVLDTASTEIAPPTSRRFSPPDLPPPPPDSRPQPVENATHPVPRGRDPYPRNCTPECWAAAPIDHERGKAIHGPRPGQTPLLRGR
jgi:hypothetical protein